MSLHTDWSNAKKDSKAKFKLALKAKRDALEKQIKEGDPKARAKALDKNLADLGLAGGDDVDKYYRFKEDFGPTLDKLQKAIAAASAGKIPSASIKSIKDVLADPKLSKAFGVVAKRAGFEEFYQFVTAGYKVDPVKAYALFIKRGAKLELNLDDSELAPLRALENDPARLKKEGPALLAKARSDLIAAVGTDALAKFKASPEGKALLLSSGAPDSPLVAALKKQVTDTSASYRKLVTASASKWSGIQPDFRKPLLDALTAIDQAVA